MRGKEAVSDRFRQKMPRRTSAGVPHPFHTRSALCSALTPHLLRTCSALAPHLLRTCAALVPQYCAALVPHFLCRTCAEMWADLRRSVLCLRPAGFPVMAGASKTCTAWAGFRLNTFFQEENEKGTAEENRGTGRGGSAPKKAGWRSVRRKVRRSGVWRSHFESFIKLSKWL